MSSHLRTQAESSLSVRQFSGSRVEYEGQSQYMQELLECFCSDEMNVITAYLPLTKEVAKSKSVSRRLHF